MIYYHGTNSDKDFNNLEFNELGLIWITKDFEAAFKYASKYYNKGVQRIFKINFTGKILDFTNKEDEIVQNIINKIKSSYLFDIEKNWETSAGFGIIESNLWIIDELKLKGYDGIFLLDQAVGHEHSSIAIFTDNFHIEEIEYF